MAESPVEQVARRNFTFYVDIASSWLIYCSDRVIPFYDKPDKTFWYRRLRFAERDHRTTDFTFKISWRICLAIIINCLCIDIYARITDRKECSTRHVSSFDTALSSVHRVRSVRRYNGAVTLPDPAGRISGITPPRC